MLPSIDILREPRTQAHLMYRINIPRALLSRSINSSAAKSSIYVCLRFDAAPSFPSSLALHPVCHPVTPTTVPQESVSPCLAFPCLPVCTLFLPFSPSTILPAPLHLFHMDCAGATSCPPQELVPLKLKKLNSLSSHRAPSTPRAIHTALIPIQQPAGRYDQARVIKNASRTGVHELNVSHLRPRKLLSFPSPCHTNAPSN